jgi:hypothetical protein
MIGGGCVALSGAALLAYEALVGGPPLRMWHVWRTFGLDLPAPADPWLVGPTLAFLNVRMGSAALGFGLILIAGFWLVDEVDD